jgi:hypothetical protein
MRQFLARLSQEEIEKVMEGTLESMKRKASRLAGSDFDWIMFCGKCQSAIDAKG